MKRELFAGLTILLLLLAAISNIIYLSSTIADVRGHINTASQAGDMGNYVQAVQELKSALEIWTSAKTQTHTLLRHSDTDSIMESFHEAISSAGQADYYQTKYAIETLRWRLETVLDMEQISLHSIF